MSSAGKARGMFAGTGLILILVGLVLVIGTGSAFAFPGSTVCGATYCVTVSVYVTVYGTGAGLSGAHVSITGPQSASGTTDGSGYAYFYNYPGGTGVATTVQVTATGYTTPSSQSQQIGSGPAAFVFTLTGGGGGTAFDFSLGVSGATTITQGQTVSWTVSLSTISGTAQSVTLSSSCPSGISCTFGSNPVTPPASSTMSVYVLSSTATGNYPVTVTGTANNGIGGTVQHGTSLTVVVQGSTSFDFSLTNNGPVTVYAPTSGTNTGSIAVTATLNTGATTQSVALTYSGTCPSSSCTLSPSSGNPTFSSTFTMSVTPSMGGAYSFTVTGSGGGKSHSTTITFNVVAVQGFDFSISPGGGTYIVQGQTLTISVSAGLLSGSSQSVSLSYSGSCPGLASCSALSPSSGNPSFTSYMTVGTSTSTTTGTYTFTFTGTGGGKTHSASFTFTVAQYVPPPPQFDFSISTPSGVSINYPSTSSGSTSVTLSLTSGSTTSVGVSVNGCPVATTCVANPSSGNPTFTATITITATSSTPSGTYTITVTGTGGGQSHSSSFQLVVNTVQFDFTFGSAGSSPTISAGNTGTIQLPVSLVSGSAQSVALTVSCPSSVASCTISPTSVTPPFTTTISINVLIGAAGGTYYVTVSGTSGSVFHQVSPTFTVPTAAPFSFSVSASAPNSVAQGNTATSQVNVGLVSGTTQQVNLDVSSGCPSSATCTLTPNTGTPPFTSTLTIATSPQTSTGTYSVTVRGTSNGVSAVTTSVSLTVNPSQTCDLTQPVVQISFIDSHGSQLFSNPSGSYTLDPSFKVHAVLLQSACTVTEVDVVFLPWQDSYSSNPPRTPVTHLTSVSSNVWESSLQGNPGGKYYFNIGVVTGSGTSWALSALSMDFGSSSNNVAFLNVPSGLWNWILNPWRIVGFVLVIVGVFFMALGIPRRSV